MPTDPSLTIPRWKFPEWQPQFQDAILEFDPRKLPLLQKQPPLPSSCACSLRKQAQKSLEPLPMHCAPFGPSRPKD